ncbi:MAG: type IV secretion system protein [Azoarcus sp.]|jgi:ribosomal protein S21|nr:type IV secretion system protein [Azoarcus sp.]
MNLKKTVLVAGMTTAMAGVMPVASAGGIPVISAAELGQSITEQVETLAQWGQQVQGMTQQYNQLVQQFQQAQKTYNALKGASNLGQIYDAIPKNQIPAEMQKAVSNAKSLAGYKIERGKLPTLEGAPKLNKMYDEMAGQRAAFKSMYDQTNARIENIGNLMTRINSAKDPGDKLDLANRLAVEQATVQANMQAMQAYEKISQEEIKQAAQEARREWSCQQFNRPDC